MELPMKFALILIAASFPMSSLATATPFEGTWAVTSQGRIVILIHIEVAKDASSYSGTIMRPTLMELSQRLDFSRVQGPAHAARLTSFVLDDAKLKFSAAPPSDANRNTQFEMTTMRGDTARLSIVGGPTLPFILVRVDADSKVADIWNSEASFVMDDHALPNEELKRLYEADQRDRADFARINWKVVSVEDEKRRQSVQQMLARDALKAPVDFYRAALIFQHGKESNDFLLAHALTMIAMSKGYADAAWLSTATLDRYLSSIKQPQIFGTQLQAEARGSTGSGFNSALISDELRRKLGVLSVAEQEVQRQEFEALEQRREGAQ
jgi:hypothetical protein